MRGLVGFLLGYYIGTKDGPERLSQLLHDVANSSEVQALRVVTLAQQMLSQMQENGAPRRGPESMSARDAWKVISESAELRGFLATGATLLQDLLSIVRQDRGNGHAPL
jgi:hypothetical protein